MTVDSLISFNREDFTNPDFISQDFIAKRKHLPVQQLTLDLNTFTKILSSELVELINNDYRDFISLSRNLIGVDTIISDLKTPLLKLNSKYFQVENELQASIDHLQEKLNDRLQLRQKKQILITYIRVNESIEKVEHLFDCLGECLVTIKEDPVTFIQYVKRVERVAIEYSQLDYLLAKGKSEPFISNQIWKAEKIKSELTVNLVNLIQVVYTEVSSSPINEDANQTLLQLLRIFVSLDTVSEATKTFEETILTPFFESELSGYQQLPNEDNLDGLFEPILAFVRSRCMKIYEISTIAFKGIENNLLAKLNLIDRSVSSPTALSPLSPISNISNGGVSMLDLMIQIQGILGSTLNLLPAIKLTHFIVDSLVQQCSQPFKNIANIPAQYRKTNKEVPKTASYFISSIFQPLKDFLDLRPLDDQIKSQWKGLVLDQISQKYSSQVIKTLQQVKTIEESLKRFSKKKKKVESNISDEDKIRTVFALD
ncbi:Conserved oligomeric Golgi complex subunit 2, partial [Globomyces sp. JEL0801]